MKIQKLTIHNIASIEDATIDFTVSPLSDSDVFLITGKTGSGKTTLLDAICLALYNNTPRLDSTRMEGAVDMAGKEIPLDNPAQLLRKTAGEGFVKLSFEGSNGIPYTAEWSIARAHGKADGRIQSRKWVLSDLHSGTVYTKEVELKAEIQRAVGLTFDQFCRTTMLAQGQFTKFLDSKDEEKAQILEMITGADIYSKMGAKVFEMTRDKEAAYQYARNALQGIVLLSEEQKEQKREALREKSAGVAALQEAMEAARTRADWLERETELRAEKARAEAELSEAKAVTGSDAFLAEGERIRAYRDTAQVRGELATCREQTRLAAGAEAAIRALSGTCQTVKAGYRYQLDQKRQTEASLAEVRAALDREKSVSQVIAKAQALYAQLDILQSGAVAVHTLETRIAAQEKQVDETLKPACDAARVKEDAAKRHKENTALALKAAEDTLTAADLSAVRRESAALVAMKGKIDLAKERIGHVAEARAARRKEADALAACSNGIADRITSRAERYEEACRFYTAMQLAQRSFDAERTARENFVGDMRRRLQVGDFCPVCMQEIQQALPTDAEVENRLRPIEEAFLTARTAYEEKKRALDALDAAIQAQQDQLTERKRRFDADRTLPLQEDAALAALQECGIDSFDTEAEYKLGVMAEKVRLKKAEIDGREEKGKGLEEQVAEARRLDRLAGDAYELARAALAQAENDVKEAVSRMERDKAVLESQRKTVQNAEGETDAIVKGTPWEAAWRENPGAFREEVENAVQAHLAATEQQSLLEDSLRALEQETQTVGQLLLDVEKIAPSWAALPAGEAAEVRNLTEKGTSLKDRLLVENRNLSAAEAAAREARSKVADFLAANPGYSEESLEELSRYRDEQIAAWDDHRKEALAAEMKRTGILQGLENQLKEHTAKRPAIEEGETVEVLRDRQATCHADILAMTSEAALLEAELQADAARQEQAGKQAEKVDALRLERDRWARLNEMIGDSTGKKFQKIAQSYVLGSLVSAANYYMKELSDRYTLEVVPGTFIILLEDAYQGFEKRPACTSSGGEGFLVSLALALALSDIGDNALSVDTLFIDEGFGTLSGEPLQNAINTLKTLRKKAGRHVGIISHIPEVREKIPVKVVLEQDNRTGSSTVRLVSEDW